MDLGAMFHTAQPAAPILKQRLHTASRPIYTRLDERWIAFIGKLSLEKGVHCLIAAAPEIIARVPNAHLLLIGDGVARSHLVAMRDALAEGNLDATVAAMRRAAETSPESYAEWVAEYWAGRDLQDYCALARAANLKHRIVFTGYQTAPNVAQLVTHADIVVIPSLIKEAFPLVSVEALSSGLMFVAPYDGGLAPVLDRVDHWRASATVRHA
jgi:glycosyltransferase involved in cell wall biosynthesis